MNNNPKISFPSVHPLYNWIYDAPTLPNNSQPSLIQNTEDMPSQINIRRPCEQPLNNNNNNSDNPKISPVLGNNNYDWLSDAPTLPDEDQTCSRIETVRNFEETKVQSGPVRIKYCRIRNTRSTFSRSTNEWQPKIYRVEKENRISDRPSEKTVKEMEGNKQFEKEKIPLTARYPKITEMILQPSIFIKPSKTKLEKQQVEIKGKIEMAAQDEHIAALLNTSFEHALPDSTTSRRFS